MVMSLINYVNVQQQWPFTISIRAINNICSINLIFPVQGIRLWELMFHFIHNVNWNAHGYHVVKINEAHALLCTIFSHLQKCPWKHFYHRLYHTKSKENFSLKIRPRQNYEDTFPMLTPLKWMFIRNQSVVPWPRLDLNV